MKKFLLALSLAANAALVLAVVDRTTHALGLFSTSSAASTASDAASAARAAAAANTVDPETWTNLTTGDLAATGARLQAEGYPPRLQRAILAALISEHFADRHQALADLISAHPWWRGNLYGSATGAKVIAARQLLQRDEKDLLEQLLGPDSSTSDYARARQVRQAGDLPAAKMSELNRINSDYDELISEVRRAAQNILLPEDREKLAFLQQEQRADIAKLLTPDELFEYDLRSSPTASSLRYQLSAFNATEDEYRAIFKVQQAFDAQYPSPELMTPDQRRQRGEAQAQLTSQIKAVLPPDRFADYELKTDYSYIQANALVTRLELPPTATADVVAVQKDITTRANAVRSDPALTPDQRNLQLTALGAEASGRLFTTLGDAGLAAYKQNGGYWLNQLQRPPTPPPPAPTKK